MGQLTCTEVDYPVPFVDHFSQLAENPALERLVTIFGTHSLSLFLESDRNRRASPLACSRNNGSLQDLHTKLREIFPRPPWLCIIGPHGTGKTHMLSHVHDILKQRSIQVEVVEELARCFATHFCFQGQMASIMGPALCP